MGGPMERLGSQKGESLVSVMVAMGVTALLISGLLTYMNNMNSQVKSIEARTEALELLSEVKSILALTNACRLNFQGRTLPEIGEPISMANLKFANAAGDGLTTRDIVAVDQKLPHGSIIQSIGLVPTTAVVAGSAFIGKLELALEMKGAFVPSIKRATTVTIATDSTNRIVDCRIDGSGGGGGGLRSCSGAPEACWDLSVARPISCDNQVYDSGAVFTEPCHLNTGSGAKHICIDGSWSKIADATCAEFSSGP